MYIDILTKSITGMIEEVIQRKKMPDYLVKEDIKVEERIKIENDLLQQAKSMGNEGIDMFCSMVEMQNDYFALKQANQILKTWLDKAIKDGDQVSAYYKENEIVDPTQVTKSKSVPKSGR